MSAGVNRSHESSLAYWLWQFMVADTSESIFVPQCLWEQRWREAAGQRQYHNSCFTTGDNAQLFLDWLKEGTLVIVPAIMTLNHVDLLGPKWILNRMRLNLCLFKSAYLHTLCSWNWALHRCFQHASKSLFLSVFSPLILYVLQTALPVSFIHTEKYKQGWRGEVGGEGRLAFVYGCTEAADSSLEMFSSIIHGARSWQVTAVLQSSCISEYDTMQKDRKWQEGAQHFLTGDKSNTQLVFTYARFYILIS